MSNIFYEYLLLFIVYYGKTTGFCLSSKLSSESSMSLRYPTILRTKRDEYVGEISSENMEPSFTLNSANTFRHVTSIVVAADKKKALRINALHLANISNIADYMVNIEASSNPQCYAISFEIQTVMRAEHNSTTFQDGNSQSGWISMDYGNILVNIMTSSMRNRYNLEGIWPTATMLNTSEILNDYRYSTLGIIPPDYSNSHANDSLESSTMFRKENDPFWS